MAILMYTGGTTGLPKGIVHSHGGIVVEHLKALALQYDLGPGDRFLWFTTTGWMMWNFLVGGLLVGATLVLYDGSPAHPDMDVLWDVAARHRVTLFGVSAPYYNDYRYRRRPTENLIIGRMFHIREKTFFQIRGEMFNAFNRTRMPNPDGSNPLATPVFSNLGVPTAGFGRINAASSTAGERTVQLVGRFQF